jgi:hypothetical protein
MTQKIPLASFTGQLPKPTTPKGGPQKCPTAKKVSTGSHGGVARSSDLKKKEQAKDVVEGVRFF